MSHMNISNNNINISYWLEKDKQNPQYVKGE